MSKKDSSNSVFVVAMYSSITLDYKCSVMRHLAKKEVTVSRKKFSSFLANEVFNRVMDIIKVTSVVWN